MMDGKRWRIGTLNSLRHRNFLFMWLSTLTAGGGFWCHQLTMGWLIFDLTHSPLLTAIILSLDSLPFLLAAPISGTIADLWDRRKTMATVCSYQAALTAGFAILLFIDNYQPWHVVVFVLVLSPSWSISEACRVALVPNIVPNHDLVNAFALREVAFNSTRLVLPIVTGVTITAMGPGIALILPAILYLGAVIAILAMRTKDVSRREARQNLGFTELFEGLQYTRDHPKVLALISIFFLVGLFVIPGLQALMPVYASEVYQVGPSGLGLLFSTIGVGALLGTLSIATLGNIRHKGQFLLGTLAVATIGMAVFSQISSIALSLTVLMVASGGLASFWALSAATLQTIVPDHLRGRVWSVAGIGFGLMSLGGLLLGGVAEVLGPQTATLLAGGVMVVILTAIWPTLKIVWRLK